jgi:ribokinase
MGRVVVVGSSNTDMTVRVPRLPAAGETVLGSTFAATPGGKGANQAVAARRAGAEVVFITAVGSDALGRQALEHYESEKIDTSQVRVVAGTSSGVALIFVGENGENMIGVAPGANCELTPEDIDRLPDHVFDNDGVLLVSLEVPLVTAQHALRRGFDAGMLTILNPAPAPALAGLEATGLFRGAGIITPNGGEALALAGINPAAGDEPDWNECGFRLKAMGPAAAVITLGARGCRVIDAKPWSAIPAPAVRVVDTVGAGDAFNGALAAALSEGRAFSREVVAWACAAGALAVTQRGAQTSLPSRDAIDRLAAATR